jgi:hypothetical protein
MATRYTLLHVLCWTYPLVVMIVCLAEGEIKFEFANLCLVNVDKIFDLFFYPMAGLVCPAFLIHLSTFFYIAKVAIKETWSLDQKANPKLVFTAVRIQWRALLLAILSTITVVFYWVRVAVHIKNDA